MAQIGGEELNSCCIKPFVCGGGAVDRGGRCVAVHKRRLTAQAELRFTRAC